MSPRMPLSRPARKIRKILCVMCRMFSLQHLHQRPLNRFSNINMSRFHTKFVAMSLLCVASLFSLVTRAKLSSLPPLEQQPKPIIFSPTSISAAKAKVVPAPVPSPELKQTVEHIVLFKMKEGTDEETVIDALNSLKCLPGVLYLSSGYVHAIHSAPLDFNILLHSRHATKEDLDGYMGHRLKYAFTMTYTEPYYQDCMIIDYVTEHEGPLVQPTYGNALRATFFKLKDGWGEADKIKVLKVIADSLEGYSYQHTFGESYVGTTYRPASKGYELGTLAVFAGVKEMMALGSPKGFAHKQKYRLKETLDANATVFVVDYVIKQVYDGNRDHLW